MFARPGPIVDGARQRRGLLSQFCIILRLTPSRFTPLSERLKVDFALIDQKLQTKFFGLYRTLSHESKFETGCVAGAPKKVPHGLHLNWRNSAQNHQ